MADSKSKSTETVVEYELEDGRKAWGAVDSRGAREAAEAAKGRKTESRKAPAAEAKQG